MVRTDSRARAELCAALALPPDASLHEILRCARRIARGRTRMGSLFAALRIAPGAGYQATMAAVERVLHPVDHHGVSAAADVESRSWDSSSREETYDSIGREESYDSMGDLKQ